MSQPELFTAADLTQPAPARPPRPAPVPHRLRRHLTQMLAEVRFYVRWPWRDWEFRNQNAIFTGMARDLGEEEAADWIAQWEAEVARLRAAPHV